VFILVFFEVWVCVLKARKIFRAFVLVITY
jgi:hypothetical protein